MNLHSVENRVMSAMTMTIMATAAVMGSAISKEDFSFVALFSVIIIEQCDVLSTMLHNNVCCIISCYVSFVVLPVCCVHRFG